MPLGQKKPTASGLGRSNPPEKSTHPSYMWVLKEYEVVGSGEDTSLELSEEEFYETEEEAKKVRKEIIDSLIQDYRKMGREIPPDIEDWYQVVRRRSPSSPSNPSREKSGDYMTQGIHKILNSVFMLNRSKFPSITDEQWDRLSWHEKRRILSEQGLVLPLETTPPRIEAWKAKHGDPLLNYPPKYRAYVQGRLKEAPPPFKPSSIDVSDKTAIIHASEYRDNKWYLWSLAPSSKTWKSLGEYRGNPTHGEENVVGEPRKEQLAASVKFAMRQWGVPGEVMDQMDLDAHLDSKLSMEENLENLKEIYPVLQRYSRGTQATLKREEIAGEEFFTAKEMQPGPYETGGYWSVIFNPKGIAMGRYAESLAKEIAKEKNALFSNAPARNHRFVGSAIATYYADGSIMEVNRILSVAVNPIGYRLGTITALLDTGKEMTASEDIINREIEETKRRTPSSFPRGER